MRYVYLVKGSSSIYISLALFLGAWLLIEHLDVGALIEFWLLMLLTLVRQSNKNGQWMDETIVDFS